MNDKVLYIVSHVEFFNPRDANGTFDKMNTETKYVSPINVCVERIKKR